MNGPRMFLLTEAAAMLPLVRRILVDVREARSRISSIGRDLEDSSQPRNVRQRAADALDAWQKRLDQCSDEAADLGFLISAGIRCEAWFPFQHRWVGPQGDGKLRPAYLVYSDGQETITEWFFAGWPADRRQVWPHWWKSQAA